MLLLVLPVSAAEYEKPYRDIEAGYHQILLAEEWEAFIEALATSESGGDWYVINSIGAIGRYQFTEHTLQNLGYSVTSAAFKCDSSIFTASMQHEALKALFRYNETILSDFINHYDGMIVDGVFVTKGGILAAAHLSGAGGVKAWLCSAGTVNRSDGHTSVKDYLIKFSAYRLK